MAITNGYAGTYAYLEQYFTDALAIDANGNVTTNSAGVLSPYGEFFPTMAGPAALVTMPDIDTGQQGTGVVNVIKLQLDVNHDGIMDLSFAGPDNTSASQPFVFWINNDCDWATYPAALISTPAQTKRLTPCTPITIGIAGNRSHGPSGTWRITPGSGFAACLPSPTRATRSR